MTTPAYVHALLDALIEGGPLDFGGSEVPADVRERLEEAAERHALVPDPAEQLRQIRALLVRSRNVTHLETLTAIQAVVWPDNEQEPTA